jgi:hypothetical protein
VRNSALGIWCCSLHFHWWLTILMQQMDAIEHVPNLRCVGAAVAQRDVKIKLHSSSFHSMP